ncbi:MAG: helix-turn-helix transcriptional regulator [Ruminococcaceae bacterium]|nr:helix-turn-helix transcriptional regulator [Oscillospiraceae bacterium]
MIMDFGKQLKIIRKQKGYTQDELALEMNQRFGSKLTKSALSRYENNRLEMTAKTVQQLAQILEVSPAVLMRQPKEKVELSDYIEEVEKDLRGMMQSGELQSPEDAEKIILAMKLAMNMVNEENKKYIPRKYRQEE